jgi:6-phosphofructokinase 1
MTTRYDIARLGAAEFDSPVDSAAFIEEDSRILLDARVKPGSAAHRPPSFERAGPRRKVFFNPASARAAIVTCGGLCPGLNDVIRGIVMVLWNRYGLKDILGIRYGYQGLTPSGVEPVPLTPDIVEDIHQHGGTVLGSSRGHQKPSVMADFLAARGINMLFAVGGDGTQRGARAIAAEASRRGLPVSIVGIPKTIDNDISYTERTFGFETAVAESQAAITGAHMESKGVLNGIGLVKLMGRESGFVAVHASLASSDVNLVLIPESPFAPGPVCNYLKTRLDHKAHAVVVVAEGAGQELLSVTGTDASGNRKLGDIGLFLKSAIADYFRAIDMPVSVKYIDPSYIIRSAPANANDSVFCFQLAENAVHAAMSGANEMVVCLWNDHFVHVPNELATGRRKKVDTRSLLWQSVLDNTGQPRDLSGERE